MRVYHPKDRGAIRVILRFMGSILSLEHTYDFVAVLCIFQCDMYACMYATCRRPYAFYRAPYK